VGIGCAERIWDVPSGPVCMPVISVERDGAHIGDSAKARVKRMPRAASRSM